MRILFLTPRFPSPPLKGDQARVYDQLRTLHAGHEISLLSLAEVPVGPDDLARVAPLCREVTVVPLPRWRAWWNLGRGLASAQPLQVGYYQAAAVGLHLRRMLAAGPFDVVHTTLIRMLPYVWHLARPPVLVDLIDSLSLNLESRRGRLRGSRRLVYELEYRRVRAYERAAGRHFPALVVQSAADQQALDSPHVTVLPNGVSAERFPFHGPEGRDGRTLVFVGNMGYPPNEEAVLWFGRTVWPQLQARYPDLRWQVVGPGPSARVQALAAAGPGIAVLGRVEDVTVYLGRAAVAVCPMLSGSGIQTKVLEALATGTPVVASSLANRGVGAVAERDLLVADTAAAFAAAVGRLLDDGAARARLGAAGRAFVDAHFRWDQHARGLETLYARLAGREAAGAR